MGTETVKFWLLRNYPNRYTMHYGRVHTRNFTRRANRSRTVRVGLPVYTLRALRRVQDLTRFNKIAIQGTPQMAVD